MPPRTLHKLSRLTIETKSKPGLYGDGGGLWLQVSSKTSKSWLFRYMRNGKPRTMGLGSLREVGPVKARKRAAEKRELLEQGLDPIEEREREAQQEKIETAKAMTFKECAERFIDTFRSEWRNAKHAAQWRSTLSEYAYPVIGDLPVNAVDTDLVLKIVSPIWNTKTETAARVRNRIERVLDWARVMGKRTGENPARWRGHLDKTLPKRRKVQKVKHHPALSYELIGQFMADLRKMEGTGARALEFTILTAARSEETFFATPAEFDLDAAAWTIPAGRIKNGKEHRVPLPARAVEIVRDMLRLKEPYVFPGWKNNRPLSNSGMTSALKRLPGYGKGYGKPSVHGFRSTFRDWAAEQTNFPRELAEKALSHTIGDETERAYQRGDLFDKRRKVMDAWERYCLTERRGKVLSIEHARR